MRDKTMRFRKLKEIEDKINDKIEDNCLNPDGESCKEKADGYYCDNCIIVLYTDVSIEEELSANER